MGTLVCRIEMSKTDGITVTVENADDKVKQTVSMDGKIMTLKVVDDDKAENTSSIVMDKMSIAIKTTTFTLDASKTITVTSKEETSHTSDKEFKITSKDALTVESTKDTKFTSKAKFAVDATDKMSVDSKANIELTTAAADAKISALNIKSEAKTGYEAKGLTMKLEGTTGFEAKGLKVDMKADTMANFEGAMTTVKGQMMTVSGSLVKIGS